MANTTARPCPDTTEVPASRMLRASSACSSTDGAASQLRGRDSPVTVAQHKVVAEANDTGTLFQASCGFLIPAGKYYKVLGTLPCTEAELIAESDTLYAESAASICEQKKED